MKIHYWLGIIVITSIGFLLARNVHSLSLPENNSSTPAALQSDTGQVQSIALPACPNPQNLDINSLPEQELRAFASYCAYLSLANEDFGTIDSSIDYLRSNKIRTPSGMWLQSLFYAGIEQYLGNANSDVWFMQLEESLQHWIAASKNPDTAHLAMTDLMIHKAWFYRGTGAASEVSTDNFRLFFKQISNAKKYLLEHKSISTRDPEWFSQMLIVTRVEENSSEKTHKQYFDEAVKLFPDYYPVYFSASEFYVTRWGGSDEEFEAFA